MKRLCHCTLLRELWLSMHFYRRWFGVAIIVCLGCLMLGSLSLMGSRPHKQVVWRPVDSQYKKQVHEYGHRVLQEECRPGRTRQKLLERLPTSSQATQPFLWKDKTLPDNLFEFPPPFGFRQLEVEDLLNALPTEPEGREPGKCRRCVVVGNGGILKGLQLGPLIDRFDTIIRLNRGPLGEFSVDVGNRTSIRMSYPEGTPLRWMDADPNALFVAVVYKGVDVSWISAMINKLTVSVWDWLFFWQAVPSEISIRPEMFRLLNPLVIRETSLDLLKFPQPRPLLWGWDQNVPTLGASALNLASLLCDEVSLAGFGYNLSHHDVPLHYYDNMSMRAMERETMHNVNKETQLLKKLVEENTITDLTGGIVCKFCSR